MLLWIVRIFRNFTGVPLAAEAQIEFQNDAIILIHDLTVTFSEYKSRIKRLN